MVEPTAWTRARGRWRLWRHLALVCFLRQLYTGCQHPSAFRRVSGRVPADTRGVDGDASPPGVNSRKRQKGLAKDSDGYKVVNCTRAQPVFHRFGRLARGKVISVTVLSASAPGCDSPA